MNRQLLSNPLGSTTDCDRQDGEAELILVVEDNPVENMRLCKLLRNAGFAVMAVDGGATVLERTLRDKPALILLDALMPDLDGFAVCEQLRAAAPCAHIPIVMLTGLDDIASIERAYRVGATDFFTKPVNPLLLEHRIRYLLRATSTLEQLRVSQQSLASAQRVAGLGHWELDIRRQQLKLSEQMCALYGLTPPEPGARGYQALLEHCHPEDRADLEQAILAAMGGVHDHHVEHRLCLPDGSLRYIDVHMTKLADDCHRGSYVLGISMDISARKASEREMLRLAYLDRLTGLPNRSLLELYLEKVIPAAHINGLAVALLAIDLDLFNRVNNSMGYEAGNAVLSQLTERGLQQLGCDTAERCLDRLMVGCRDIPCDQRGIFARLGADSFVLALPDVERDSTEVRRFAETLKRSFQQPFLYRGQELFVTASIGIAFSETGSAAIDDLLQQADLALHEVKRQGRNGIRRYSSDLVSRASAHLSIQSDLRRALAEQEFKVYYQPKIAVGDLAICGFEALVRWQHPHKGLISPEHFIQVAEDSGLIVELGQWVLATACRQHARWLQQWPSACRMAVNVTSRQFKQGDFVAQVERVLENAGLAARHLELELTEGVLMSDARVTQDIARLRALGVSIALDDFGTGYSSLSYITRFPIDTIKIDRCFVQDIQHGNEKAAIVSAVTDLSHKLNFNVVAEGMETEQELIIVQQLNCDEVQGFWYCPPMAASAMTQWLEARHFRQ